MLTLLLLLQLYKSLADQVCLTISNHTIEINGTDANITEHQNKMVDCQMDCQASCVFLCNLGEKAWFNGTSDCLDVKKKTATETEIIYNLENNRTCSLYPCLNSSILRLIDSLDYKQKNVITLFNIRNLCLDLFSNNRKLKWTFINEERKAIHTLINNTQTEVALSSTYNQQYLSLNVINISKAPVNSIVEIEAPQLYPQNHSFIPKIWLPADALKTIPEEKRVIGLVSYMYHGHFQFDQEKILSVVLRIEVLGEEHLRNLASPIKMTFRVKTDKGQLDNDSQLVCHYFDEFDEHGSPWKTDGCKTQSVNQSDEQDIACYCDHATPFAVLLIRGQIAAVHWKILSYISYIGCGLSAFFTALSVLMYAFSRNRKLDYSLSIHVSLSGALFLLNSSFLLTEWGATLVLEGVCVFVAAFMHYSLLCSFTWMAIEGLHLYLLLIKVFNTYYKHYLLKLSLVGWGIPGVIVAVSVGVMDFKQFYGVKQMTMADTNQTSSICWITDDTFFYSLNLVYFILVFIFNAGILMAVASSICKMKQVLQTTLKTGATAKGKLWGDRERLSASCKSGLTLFGLTCLMGTTWGLAFLGSGYINYPILYLFCILNSTQGFFIFLWICLSAKKQRKRAMEDRTSSAPVRTTEIKSD